VNFNSPFKTFNVYLRNRFGERVQRVALHAGMTCPNRDGSIGWDGCIYCDNRSFNPNLDNVLPVTEQLNQGMERARRRYGARLFLAYFQTFTNTYAPVDRLRQLYTEALDHPDVAGLMIGTRPDCVSEEVLDLVTEMSRWKMTWLELGVQSCHDRTLERIRRGHTFARAVDAVKRASARGILVAVHLILGLPGETPADMVATGTAMAQLNVNGVKLHHLHAVKGTELARMYDRKAWCPMTQEEYIAAASRVLSVLPEQTVIMRLVGDCPDALLVAPRWDLSKQAIHQRILSAATVLKREKT
jgi:uncharacterized protein